MWTFTSFGMFSIVAHSMRPDHLVVRARSRTDLVSFAVRFHEIDERSPFPSIVETPAADYPFRLVVERELVAEVIARAMRSIGYPNFKDEVARLQGFDRTRLYHEVWDVMRRGLEHERQPPHATPATKKKRARHAR